jgi:uncharacterized protein YbbC (DUF1343 family)
MTQILFGIDRALATPGSLPGPLGLVTNDSARTAQDPGLPSRLALQRAGVDLARLFSPEHGLGADAADGTPVAHGVDPLTGLPVTSLYGASLRPPAETLTGLEAVLFDLPDVGARFYTYVWTLSHVMEACARVGVPVVVLDRPNPLGGELAAAEGPLLDVEAFGSFTGRATIPIRHSLTVGEVARLWKAERKLDLDLRIVPCRGWRRSMHWPDTGLPFVPTSPAMPSYESALLYPGVGLLEATNLSVGRGTVRPFQTVGAPWLAADATARAFNSLGRPGIKAESRSFTPRNEPHAGLPCKGVFLRVTDPRVFRPVGAALHLLAAVIRVHGGELRWALYPTAANPSGEGHFERLAGRAGIREVLEESPADLADNIDAWTSVPGWRESVEGHLLYGEGKSVAFAPPAR